MERISLIANQVSKQKEQPRIVKSALEWMSLDNYFSPEENTKRKQLRDVLEKEIMPKLPEYIDKAEFPTFVLPILKSLDLTCEYIGKPYGNGHNYNAAFYTLLEMGRADGSLSTFFLVQLFLLTYTIDKYGGEALRNKYLPKLIKLEWLGGWGLTEKEIGSDAGSIQTHVKKVEGGYILNGNKKWIGNACFDMLVVFAKNTNNNQVNAFAVETSWKGVRREVIKNKYPLRPVQNMILDFEDVFIPEENILTNVKNFHDVGEILAHSRLWTCVQAAGITVGLYDFTISYITERKQFGKSISSYQLVQEKIVRVMAIAQESVLIAKQLLDQKKNGKLTMGQIAMVKAHITTQARESARLAREVKGANGILIENYAMKALLDIEGLHTYEGTKDINTLIAGREITGVSSFKQNIILI